MYTEEDLETLPLIDIIETVEAKKDLSEIKYATWLDYGSEYVPAVNLKTCDKIPSGVYKVTYSREEYKVIPSNINTDELFTFSESYTTKILNEVNDFWNKKDVYKQHNISHKRGILLSGRPGTGKSAIISLLIKQLLDNDGLIFLVNNLKDFNILFDSLNPVIRKIEQERPIITIIEDIDKLIEANNGDDSQFLDFLDGKNSVEHHLVLMTSNNTSELSDALLRPSRIDMHFVLDVPNKSIRKEYLKKKGINDDLLEEYSNKTEGFSFAELKEVFISTAVMGKNIDDVVEQIKNPTECKNYLNLKQNKLGL